MKTKAQGKTGGSKRVLHILPAACMVALTLSCNSSGPGHASTDPIEHPDPGTGNDPGTSPEDPLPTPTSARCSVDETYTYNFSCSVALTHNCVLETDVPEGGNVEASCTVETSQVQNSTCLPASLKNVLLATGSPTVIVSRLDNGYYQLTVTLTQGWREVIDVQSLTDLYLKRSNKEIGRL